jgi:hypothetical protein
VWRLLGGGPNRFAFASVLQDEIFDDETKRSVAENECGSGGERENRKVGKRLRVGDSTVPFICDFLTLTYSGSV